MINANPSYVLSLEAESYLQLLRSVAPVKGSAYAAVPITTGTRFLKWYVECGSNIVEPEKYAEGHRRSVVEPNCADAGARIAVIRKTLQVPVIDPSAFERPGWSQEEYRNFWAAVIRRYASVVVFLHGWQYSNGCSFEFYTAVTGGITTLNDDLQPLSRDVGLGLIRGAASEFRSQGIQVPFLETVLQKLETEGGATILQEGAAKASITNQEDLT